MVSFEDRHPEGISSEALSDDEMKCIAILGEFFAKLSVGLKSR